MERDSRNNHQSFSSKSFQSQDYGRLPIKFFQSGQTEDLKRCSFAENDLVISQLQKKCQQWFKYSESDKIYFKYFETNSQELITIKDSEDLIQAIMEHNLSSSQTFKLEVCYSDPLQQSRRILAMKREDRKNSYGASSENTLPN